MDRLRAPSTVHERFNNYRYYNMKPSAPTSFFTLPTTSPPSKPQHPASLHRCRVWLQLIHNLLNIIFLAFIFFCTVLPIFDKRARFVTHLTLNENCMSSFKAIFPGKTLQNIKFSNIKPSKYNIVYTSLKIISSSKVQCT